MIDLQYVQVQNYGQILTRENQLWPRSCVIDERAAQVGLEDEDQRHRRYATPVLQSGTTTSQTT